MIEEKYVPVILALREAADMERRFGASNAARAELDERWLKAIKLIEGLCVRKPLGRPPKVPRG